MGYGIGKDIKTGVFAYNTDTGLRRWRAALAKVKAGTNQVVNVPFIGDSITEGALASDFVTKGYLGRIRAALNAKYGDAGFGMIPTYFPYGSPMWSFTGTWTDDWNYGPSRREKQSATNGDTATLTFTGTGIGIVVVQGGGAGQFDVSIDGGAATTFNANGGLQLAKTFEINGLADTSHTMVITNKGTTGVQTLWLAGAYVKRGSSGVRIHMVGRYGTTTNDHAFANALPYAIDVWQPPLTIVALTANDISNSVSLATYTSNLLTIVNRALTFGDCLLVSVGSRTDYWPAQSPYIQSMKTIALQTGSAFIDIANRWGGDPNYAKNTLGFISDTVHPTDYGHSDIASAILRVIDEY